MDHNKYVAEHRRLFKVLEGAKTAAAAKELAKQRKEVDIAMKKTMKPKDYMMMKAPAMIPGQEY